MNNFTRICPSCGLTISHTIKNNRDFAERKKKICNSCRKLVFVKKFCGPGENNAFHGHKHSSETKDKFKMVNKDYTKTLEFKATMSEVTKGSKNGMFNKTFYQIWLQKYGKEEADHRMISLKRKHSQNNSGSNNPMYGKPAPIGSGCGWSGWYKGWYFRSLKELSYVINVLEQRKLEWKTGETLRIPYIDPSGKQRNYSPDFIVSENKLIEIKPEQLKSCRIVRAKADAAEQYCKEKGLSYQIIDPPPLSNEQIRELKDSGAIQFLDRFEKKFEGEYR